MAVSERTLRGEVVTLDAAGGGVSVDERAPSAGARPAVMGFPAVAGADGETGALDAVRRVPGGTGEAGAEMPR